MSTDLQLQAVCCRRIIGLDDAGSFFVDFEKRFAAMTVFANRRIRPEAAGAPSAVGDDDDDASRLLWFEAVLAACWLNPLRLELSSPKTKRFCETVWFPDDDTGPIPPADPARPTHDDERAKPPGRAAPPLEPAQEQCARTEQNTHTHREREGERGRESQPSASRRVNGQQDALRADASKPRSCESTNVPAPPSTPAKFRAPLNSPAACFLRVLFVRCSFESSWLSSASSRLDESWLWDDCGERSGAGGL